MTDIAKLRRDEVEEAEKNLLYAKRVLADLISNCKHEWSAVEEVHIYEKDYTIPAAGLGGIDWRPSCYVPERTTREWKRTCMKCGEIQRTSMAEETTILNPKF